MPLQLKIEYVNAIRGFNQLSVCDDISDHYDYWRQNVNYNPDDCCNVSR